MEYLNRDHITFRKSPTKLVFAIQTLINLALSLSHSFRIQFDRSSLEKVIGTEELMKVMPGLDNLAILTESAITYDIHEEQLSYKKAEILKKLLSFETENYDDLPLNYIKNITLLNKNQQIVFRANDMNLFQLFVLPEAERAALIKIYASENIPAEVIEKLDIDSNNLYP